MSDLSFTTSQVALIKETIPFKLHASPPQSTIRVPYFYTGEELDRLHNLGAFVLQTSIISRPTFCVCCCVSEFWNIVGKNNPLSCALSHHITRDPQNEWILLLSPDCTVEYEQHRIEDVPYMQHFGKAVKYLNKQLTWYPGKLKTHLRGGG